MMRRMLALLFTLCLAGCSYSYPVEAVFIDGKLHFVVKEKLNGCLSDFVVKSDDGQVVWAIDGDFRSPPCESNFPLAYGVAPTGMKTLTPAQILKPGVLYKIEGSDGDRYYGAFTYRRTLVVTNTPQVARFR